MVHCFLLLNRLSFFDTVRCDIALLIHSVITGLLPTPSQQQDGRNPNVNQDQNQAANQASNEQQPQQNSDSEDWIFILQGENDVAPDGTLQCISEGDKAKEKHYRSIYVSIRRFDLGFRVTHFFSRIDFFSFFTIYEFAVFSRKLIAVCPRIGNVID